MERKIISHRIGSILDDISRLSNALYAMDTTDIQRYPDNYEVLSTDAALRAEKIACRLRHLIYSSTTIRKGDYLTSAGIVHGIEVVYEDGVLEVTLPGLLPKRKQRQNTEFLLDPFYFSLEQYAKEHPMPHFSDCVVCFTQVYDQCLPTRRIRDYDNLEEKQLLDVLSTFVMADDTGLLCDAYNTAALGEKDCTRISVMEKKRFPAWLAEHENTLKSISVFLSIFSHCLSDLPQHSISPRISGLFSVVTPRIFTEVPCSLGKSRTPQGGDHLGNSHSQTRWRTGFSL